MHQIVNSYVCLKWQSYETVFETVGLIVSRVEGVAILPTLAALPHSPLGRHIYSKSNITCEVGVALTGVGAALYEVGVACNPKSA